MAEITKEGLEVLQSALELVRSIGVTPLGLLSYSIAVDCAESAAEWNSEETDPDQFISPVEMVVAEFEALIDDGARDFVRDVYDTAWEMRKVMDGEEAE